MPTSDLCTQTPTHTAEGSAAAPVNQRENTVKGARQLQAHPNLPGNWDYLNIKH